MSTSNLKLATEVITNEEFYQAVGKNIKQFREKAKLSQAQIAAQIGVSEQQIEKYESGQASVYLHMISAIAGALGVSINDLAE